MNSYPTGSQEIGIRVWHVDARLFYYNNNYSSAFTFTTNPNVRNHTISVAMSNTYAGGDADEYLSPLGSGYYDFNVLQLIRNNTNATYTPTDGFDTNALFRMGSSFTMSKYNKQFVKSGKLNQNIDLGFSFTVDNTIADYATITVTKA